MISINQPCTVYRVPYASAQDRRLSASGFTLFELLIVLVIIGLVSSLVLPRVGRGLGGLKLRSETRKVAAALRYARSQAISENLTLRVEFDSEHRRVVVISDQVKSEDDYPWTRGKDTEEIPVVKYELSVAEEVVFEYSDEDKGEDEPSLEIVFYPSGGSSGGTLYMRSGEKKRYCLMVDEISGGVKVLEDEKNDLG